MAKKYKVIVNVKGHVYESGATSPNYVTVCKKPHWDTEGIMLQGNLGDATKFEVYDSDVDVIFEYTKKRYEGKREFAIVEVDERILSTPLREVWGIGDIKGDFDETGLINGNFVKEVHKEEN